MTVSWNSEVKAIIDKWTNYNISLDEFKEIIMVKGQAFAVGNGAIAMIIDSTQANGVFRKEIQEFIAKEAFETFAANGIKYFITATSKVSALTKMTVRNYSSKAGPAGIQLVEVNNTADAILWLKEHALKAA